MITFLQLLIVALSIFLVLLILIQRGRGGGLAGAFGGAGGQSAIGTRAGDVFTRITFICILLWFVLNGVTAVLMRKEKELYKVTRPAAKKAADDDGSAMGAGDKKPSKAPSIDGDAEKSGNSSEAAAEKSTDSTAAPKGESKAEADDAKKAGDKE